MQERNGSVRMFHHRNQVFRFKHKVFLLNIEDNGSMVPIKEMNRQRTYTVRIDFSGVHWLLESLKSAAHQFKDKVFFSRYLASYAMFTLEKYSNKNGSFIRLLEIRKSTVTIIVIFSAGPKGNGWFGLVNSMHSLLYSPSSLNIVNNNKINWIAAKRWKAKPGRKVEGRISYVDAVRKSFVNNIVYKRERQISIEAMGNHAMSKNFSSGGTNPIDVPPLSEGEEVVVLEHSTQVDDALAQDKNIMATSTKLICDGETQEKVEDQLNENDLEYESSSFVGNESSTETVVEVFQVELFGDLFHSRLKPEE
ncbi:hypothetical protein LguiA_007099 [Lonicera macranthoides]